MILLAELIEAIYSNTQNVFDPLYSIHRRF